MSGTSTEYLGARPLRRILRDRAVVIVSGPCGVGKTAVASRMAGLPEVAVDGDAAAHGRHLEGRRLQDAVLRRVRNGRWSDALMTVPALVLDGVEHLQVRHETGRLWVELFRIRQAAGLRTIVVERRPDGSAEALLGLLSVGDAAHLLLRFPNGPAGRRRFALRQAERIGLNKGRATGTELLEPWSYAGVSAELERRLREQIRGEIAAPLLPFPAVASVPSGL